MQFKGIEELASVSSRLAVMQYTAVAHRISELIVGTEYDVEHQCTSGPTWGGGTFITSRFFVYYLTAFY